MRAPEIEGNLHEAMDLGIFVDMVREPGCDDGGRIGASVVEGAHVLEGAGDGVLDRRPEQIGLAVEVVIDERSVDVERLGDVLDRHRGEVALGEKIERGSQELVDAAALCSSRPGLRGAALRTVLSPRFLRSISLFGWWVILPFSDFVHRSSARIDLMAGCECDAIHLTRTCISQAVKATLFCY